MCACVHACVHVRACMRACACVRACVCVFVCIGVTWSQPHVWPLLVSEVHTVERERERSEDGREEGEELRLIEQ